MRLFERKQAAAPAPDPRTLSPATWPMDPLGVNRHSALSLSVIANAQSLIVGVASQLTVKRFRGDTELEPGTILSQPDLDTTWAAQIGWTVDDLFFYGSSTWLVTARSASDGYPTRARRLPPMTAAPRIDPDYTKASRIIEYNVGGSTIAPRDVIHFEMPGSGLLRDEAAIILSALQLQAAADRYVTIPLPAGTLTNEGQEIGDADAQKIVDDFDAARLKGGTAFLQSMKYERVQISATDLQLVEAIAAVDTRLARACNLPCSVVGASPSGGASAMLYANVGQTFTQVLLQSIGPFLIAIEQGMSGQVVPTQQSVRFDTEDWLRFTAIATPTGQQPANPDGGLPSPASPLPPAGGTQ